MKTKIYLMALLLSSVALFSGCAKDGATGPAGPAGANGNANVHSQTLTITSNLWYHIGTSGSGGDGYEIIQPCSIITSSIVNTGSVLVYVSFNTLSWAAMPFTLPSGSSSYKYSQSWNYEYQANQLTVDIMDNDFATIKPSSTVYIKVVAVAASAITKNPTVDYNNYADVKKAYNLND